jgi:putative phage-type endonuclease
VSVRALALKTKAEWLDARTQGLGASDAAAVLGASPWKSPFKLYCEKIGLVDPSVEETEAMEWGGLLEPIIAEKYERETRRSLIDHGRFTLQISEERPFLFATLDREILRREQHETPGVLEIKTTGIYRAEEWAEEPPLVYQIQLQHQMAVMGWAWGSLAVLIGGQRFLWTDIERNDRFVVALLAAEAEFWRRVELGDPPPVDGMESTREAIIALYPKDSGETIALPTDAAALDESRREAIADMLVIKAKLDTAENGLKAMIGDASKGVLPGGGAYTWKLQKRAAHDVAASEFRVLRRTDK